MAGAAVEIASEADTGYYTDLLTRGGAGVEPVDATTQAGVAAILGRGLSIGEIIERDRAYLAELVADRAGIDAALARQRVGAAIAEIDEARATAIDAVERGRKMGIVFGFAFAATTLTSARAAYFAATLGGRRRDDELTFATSGPPV